MGIDRQPENSMDPRQGDPRYSRTQLQQSIVPPSNIPGTITSKDAMAKDHLPLKVWGNARTPPTPTPPEGGASPKGERTTDPRLKYAHLKIKPKGNSLHSALKKPGRDNLPSLLQSTQLDKPMAPQELFGSSGISLFGSSTQMGVAPSSPDKQQSFGEIKMAATTQEEKDDEKASRDDTALDDDTSKVEETIFVPSYLTHLGLDADSTDDSGLKIDSAFGALQERQRRLSEASTQVTEDSSQDSSNLQPDSPNKDQSPHISKMFSFGSSLF